MDRLDPIDVPAGVRARMVRGVNGLDMHVLEAGYERPGQPCLLLLHGFPELAWSWRKLLLPLAQAGYHVIAPDQRGYGRTRLRDAPWRTPYETDLAPFRMANLVRDALGLVHAMGHRSVQAVIGHDFGSPVAAWCALLRPDVFRALAMMSSPFAGPPALPFDVAEAGHVAPPDDPVHAALAALPRPRKHYQWYYSTREADADMVQAPQGLHAFLRAYYHFKSADWQGNRPYRLEAWSAAELAKMPEYYIMDLAHTMAQAVAPAMPGAAQVAQCPWLTEAELAVYAGEYARTGFQGGLQWYRCRTSGLFDAEMQTWSGRTIDVPSVFIAGASDWGPQQKPGDLEKMRDSACTRMLGCHFVPGAGHWVQQEQPGAVLDLLLGFLRAAHHP